MARYRAMFCGRARAVTLAELLVSSAAGAVLLGGLTSAMVVATHALPESAGPDGAAVAGAVGGLTSELWCATAVPSATARTITFSVPDRDNDGADEWIEYSWSGTDGDPLERRYNGGGPVQVLAAVHEFQLRWDVTVVSHEEPGAPHVSAEVELASFNPFTNVAETPVRNDLYVGQCFKPILPANALDWRITKVKFVARRDHDHPHILTVSLREAQSDGLPSATLIGSTSFSQTGLSTSHQWVERALPGLPSLSPAVRVCLTFSTADHAAARLRYQYDDVDLPGGAMVAGHPTWDVAYPDCALGFSIWGTYSTPGDPVQVDEYFVQSLHVRLRAGNRPAIETSVRTLNTPELGG